MPTSPKMHSTFFEHICRGCSSYRCLKIGSFPFNDHRHPGFSDLFICLECKTAFFTHTSRVGSNSATWHQKVFERNMEWSRIFHSYLKRSDTPYKKIIDVGCGIGTLLHYFKSTEQSQVIGFDTNAACINHGIDSYALDLRCEYFHAEHPAVKSFNADLVTCIMVFEHLDEPKILAKEIAQYCLAHGAKAYISVPFLKDLSQFELNEKHDIFNDIGGHVTYFSYQGLTSLFNSYGLKKINAFADSKMGWSGILFGS